MTDDVTVSSSNLGAMPALSQLHAAAAKAAQNPGWHERLVNEINAAKAAPLKDFWSEFSSATEAAMKAGKMAPAGAVAEIQAIEKDVSGLWKTPEQIAQKVRLELDLDASKAKAEIA